MEKNFEKYKTAEERDSAFRKFCGKRECESCDLDVKDKFWCTFAWLDLEAEEDKPMPCPFCGSDTDIEYTSLDCDTTEWYGVRCLRCEYVSKNYHSLEEAIAAHNMFTKAAMAANKEAK